MEFICKDSGSSEWHYDDANKKYIRTYKDGRKISIYGRFIPNPEKLWKEKIENAQKEGRKIDVNGMKPSDAVFSLWKHYLTTLEK